MDNLLDLMAEDLLSQMDPVAWAEREFGHSLDVWQRSLVRSTHKREILNIHRQAGKSTSAALLALHQKEVPGSLSLLVSPSQRQSSELLHTVSIINNGRGVTQESATRIEFENGSRILSLPGGERTVRGYAGVDLIILDEASRIEDELYYTIRPMVAVSGGRMLAMSTPFGKRGWFWEEWNGGIGWKRYEITAWECPRISHEFLEEERATLGDLWFAQEYECAFLDANTNLFGFDILEGLVDDSCEVWDL
jgi:hypothetical protein